MGFAYELLIRVAVVFAQVETVNATHRTVDEMVAQGADGNFSITAGKPADVELGRGLSREQRSGLTKE
jgi:hypothetical protein